jgi:hypothetical protein
LRDITLGIVIFRMMKFGSDTVVSTTDKILLDATQCKAIAYVLWRTFVFFGEDFNRKSMILGKFIC